MPALKGKCKQLTSKKSNKSCIVTKIRWVVAVHEILKQKYRHLSYIDHKLNNKMLPKIDIYFRASFLNNQFGKRLESDGEFSNEIIERMEIIKKVENTLAAEAEEKGWLRKKLSKYFIRRHLGFP